MPRNAWCSTQYGEQTYESDSQTWYRQAPEYCGAYDRIPANVDVLPSGAVAVPTYGTYEYPPAGGDPVGNSSVALFSSVTGATLRIVSLPSSRIPAGGITGGVAGGAVVPTSDTHGEANPTTGRPRRARRVGHSLSDGPGAGVRAVGRIGERTVRTCINGGTLTVTILDAARGTTWSRTVPAIAGAAVTRLPTQADGRISLVGFGCADPLATCPELSQVAVRLGSSGAIDRLRWPRCSAGPPSPTRGTHRSASRVALRRWRSTPSPALRPRGASRPGCWGRRGVPRCRLRRGRRGCRVGIVRCGCRGRRRPRMGFAVTGYRITPYRNGVAQAPVTVGNVTSRVVAGLDNGVSYRFTVAAINTVGRGPESASSASVVSGVVPAAPTNVRATSQRGQATVTWTAPPAVPGLPVTGYSMVVVADGVRCRRWTSVRARRRW